MSGTPLRKSGLATLWRLLLAGYLLALLTGTHLPPTFPGLPATPSDKVLHFLAYAGLAWLLAMAWSSTTGRLNNRHLAVAWLTLAVLAAADEVTQLLVHRSASVGDWLADVAGTATGLVVFCLTRRIGIEP